MEGSNLKVNPNATMAPQSIEEAAQRTRAHANEPLEEITPTGQYKYDPQGALQMGMTPAGSAALQKNALLAAKLAQMVGPKSVDKTIDLGDKTVVYYSDGSTKELPKGAAPVGEMTPYQKASLDQQRAEAAATAAYRNKDLDIRAQEAGLKATGTPAQQQKIRVAKAEDISNYQAAKQTANDMEKIADDLVGNPEKHIMPHPGLSGITGTQSYFPNAPQTQIGGIEITSGNAKAAQQKLDTFKGKIASLGRQIQSQNGKLGNMAVQEWRIVADSVQKIDPSAKNFEEQLRDAVRQANELAERISGRYQNEYDEAMPAYNNKSSAPSAGTVRTFNPATGRIE